jgi:hypothetical protein
MGACYSIKNLVVTSVVAKPVSSKGKGGRVTIVENGSDGKQIHPLAAQASSRDSMRASSKKILKLKKDQPVAVEQITDIGEEDDTYISPPMNANSIPVCMRVCGIFFVQVNTYEQ